VTGEGESVVPFHKFWYKIYQKWINEGGEIKIVTWRRRQIRDALAPLCYLTKEVCHPPLPLLLPPLLLPPPPSSLPPPSSPLSPPSSSLPLPPPVFSPPLRSALPSSPSLRKKRNSSSLSKPPISQIYLFFSESIPRTPNSDIKLPATSSRF
jgi:hypothetical protein